MKKDKIKNPKEEVKMVKNKYKKMKLGIILVIALIIIIYVSYLVITSLRLQNILQHNVAINLGNNYKVTKIQNGEKNNILFYKDGIFNNVFSDGTYGIYGKDNTVYQVLYQKKQYQKLEMENIFEVFSSTTLLNYMGIDREYVDSLKSMILLTLDAKVKFGSETINNQKYVTLEMRDTGAKLWIHPDSYLVEKESLQGQVTEQKIEKDVVTDDDVKAPWELGFTEISENF